ncbi:hypothetical protein SADUNF_Sadunf03G0046000 [Salix dunnii]|uniref:Uncharacterized protein n=1 Tax=Salix dunnii TaxID=1413687 RepID=A0A835N1Q6_9ROSI|nr:hypothetical protein SADUNF_Sadunf03G0046000 [Salix dunnii]
MGKLQIKNGLAESFVLSPPINSANNDDMNMINRSYGIATENLSKQKAAISEMRKAKDVKSSDDLEAGDSEEFWMRDPKTGNWIPESHFGDIAELREKVLSKKERFYKTNSSMIKLRSHLSNVKWILISTMF